MQFWIGVIVGSMVGCLVGVAYLSLVIVGKEADKRTEEAWKGLDERA